MYVKICLTWFILKVLVVLLSCDTNLWITQCAILEEGVESMLYLYLKPTHCLKKASVPQGLCYSYWILQELSSIPLLSVFFCVISLQVIGNELLQMSLICTCLRSFCAWWIFQLHSIFILYSVCWVSFTSNWCEWSRDV